MWNIGLILMKVVIKRDQNVQSKDNAMCSELTVNAAAMESKYLRSNFAWPLISCHFGKVTLSSWALIFHLQNRLSEN